MKNVAVSILICAVIAGAAAAADSPQFRGPNRDGKFPETGLLKEWPENGPPVLWVANGIGEGYASPSIVGDTLYVPGMLEGEQGYLFVLDLAGNIKSKHAYGPETLTKQAPGPRSTPTIDGDRLYLISGLGVVTCFKLPECGILWQVDMMKRFNGQVVAWAIAESPLIDGENLICTPGGPDASIAALNKMTGQTVWTSKGWSEPSAYCSPALFEVGGHRIIVTMTAKSVVGLDAATGALLWSHTHETDYDIHAVTPVLEGRMLYYTGGYGSGGGMLLLSEDGSSVTPQWADKNLDCQHHGVVLLDGYIYGTGHKNQNLMCLQLQTGKLMWEAKEVRQGALVYADGMLYVYEGPGGGAVSLVKAAPEGFSRTGVFEVTQGGGNHWAHPVISGGRLYIRHGDVLIAYDIAAK
ncbi:MAG TPA: PQQ-binding-like beta-propeller repeat protein [Candidatus Hydrogenedentes bacterium]|nr:PQQ-binding-like beta-propeller repeat protein [Candidatus Hydrogenedentota bacterium]